MAAKKSKKEPEQKDGLQEDGSYITTEQDYLTYKSETEKWVKFFGLTDFEWIVERKQTDEETRAQCWIHFDGRVANTVLQEKWDDVPYPGEIERVAFHEVMEAMLSDLWMLTTRRYLSEDEVEVARHRLIRILENSVWKQDWEGRDVQ
jgi:hypothetical protein